MDRYLFRGKRVDNGKLVEGWLFQNKHRINKYFIRHFPDKDDYYEDCAVFKETIGQCTGLKDKNGKLIFGGDLFSDGVQKWEVKYTETMQGFSAYEVGGNGIFSLYHIANRHNHKREIEIIGNIHDKEAI